MTASPLSRTLGLVMLTSSGVAAVSPRARATSWNSAASRLATGSEKTTCTPEALVDTPSSPAAGQVDTSWGTCVRKFHSRSALSVPKGPLTRELTDAWYILPGSRSTAGKLAVYVPGS